MLTAISIVVTFKDRLPESNFVQSFKSQKMKLYKSYLNLCLFILFTFQLNAQFLERHVISSFGNLSNSAELIVSFTGGELSINTLRSNDLQLTTGFQQPSPEDLVWVVDPQYQTLKIEVSPNPASISFNLSFATELDFPAKLSIWDANGSLHTKTLAFQLNAKQKIRIDCYSWESGTYFLAIYDEKSRLVRTMKAQKL